VSRADAVRTDDLPSLRRQITDLRDLCDGLAARLDAIEGHIRRDRKTAATAAEAAAVADYMKSLPDPDAPAVADDPQPGSSELVAHPPVDEERYDPEGGADNDDGPSGPLPRQVTRRAPPSNRANYPTLRRQLKNPQAAEPQFRDPAAALW
jgi:hypothetical protein